MNDFREYSELYHYGILGMKWGIRRYQNEDGSLTPAGRRRYGEDLDIKDTNRTNIAKIRLGEAKRNYDNARYKENPNHIKVAETRHRVRLAEQNLRSAKTIDKGAKLAEKGQTITGNRMKSLVGYGLAAIGSAAMTEFLNHRLSKLAFEGRYRRGHTYAAQHFNDIFSWGLTGLAVAYNIKKEIDNSKLRAYQTSRYNGSSAIKRVGSTEYQDVLKRRKKKSK